MNVYELKCYGYTYHRAGRSAADAKRSLSRDLTKRYRKRVPASHIKLVSYHRG